MKAINLPGILQPLYATNHAHLGWNTYVICLDSILWFERNAPITISNQAIAVIIQWFQWFSVIIQWCSFAVQELAPTLLQKLQRGDQDENGEHGTELFFFSRLPICCDSKSWPKQIEIVLRVYYWTLFWIYISSERCANFCCLCFVVDIARWWK